MIKFIKENKWKFIVSTLLLFVPMIVGMLLWNRLPDNMITHWGGDNVADGISPKWFTVFILPLIFIAFHWLALWLTALDNRNRSQSKKAFGILFWIFPVISVLSASFVYSTALGKSFDYHLILMLVLGLAFIIIGNYLPKVKQNSTYGIKIKWTLENEENWNMTHRFGGKIWVIGGFIFVLAAFLPTRASLALSIATFILLILVPTLYSYFYARVRRQNSEYVTTKLKTSKLTWILTALLIIGIAVLMFTGDINIEFTESGFDIKATYHTDLYISYDSIDSVELIEEIDSGVRTNGFGSPRLSMGYFSNSEFGSYTRYTYTSNRSGIVLRSDEKVLVINGKNTDSTLELYERISAQVNK